MRWPQQAKNFNYAVHQPAVCAPSRSVIADQPLRHRDPACGSNGLGMNQTLPTLASELHKAGYSTNRSASGILHRLRKLPAEGTGFGQAEWRGGFMDLFEGSNALDTTTHPYEGTIYDGAPATRSLTRHEYRGGLITDRAERFLRQKAGPAILPVHLAVLEPRDAAETIWTTESWPHGSDGQIQNSYVPPDLRNSAGLAAGASGLLRAVEAIR